MALLMPITLWSVTLIPYRMDVALSLSPATAQAQTLPEQPAGNFALDVDHIAQTITTQETAIYFIEVARKDEFTPPINLSIVNPDGSLSYKLEPPQISKTGLVKLSVTARKVRGELNQYPIVVKAQMASSKGEVVRCISVWLFVVASTPAQTIVTLAVRPQTPLSNGVIQPIEGRVVPPRPGNVVLALLDPDQVLKNITLAVDSLGRFSHNHAFRKAGPWQAAIMATGTDYHSSQVQLSRPIGNFYNSQSISFQVAKRTPRIAVTSIDPRNKKIGDRLKIVGQLVADTANVQVKIEVVSPKNKTTTLYATSEPRTGKFHAFYTIANSGLHTITASANQLQIPQPPGCERAIEKSTLLRQQRMGVNQDRGEMLIARRQTTAGLTQDNEAIQSLMEPALANSPTSQSAQSLVGKNAANNYAIILVGGSNGIAPPLLHKQNNVAAFLYERLKIRGFSDRDILLLSQSECVEAYLTRDEASFNYDSAIRTFLSQVVGDRSEKNLFVYLVGRIKDGNKYIIYNDPPAPQEMENTFADLAAFFNSNFFSGFNRVVCMIVFDHGEAFLSMLDNQLTGNPKVINLSNTGLANTLSSNDLNDPEASFTGKFAKKISEGIDIRDAFYENYNFFSTKSPMLDDNDNGAANKPNGSFEKANPIPPPPSGNYDGVHSIDEFIGVDPGNEKTSAAVTGANTGNSPAGPLVSQRVRVLASLDNPNRLPVESSTATIFSPNLSVTEVPLVLDSTAGIYKSELVCLPDSGLYRFEINFSYIDKAGEKFSSFEFEKIRHVIAAPPGTIRTGGIFFNPGLEVGLNYVFGNQRQEIDNRGGLAVGVNLFSARSGRWEFIGLGATTNFDKFWGLFTPLSWNMKNVLGSKFASNAWLYGGFGYRFDHGEVLTNDLRYFVGFKYRLCSLLPRKHRGQ